MISREQREHREASQSNVSITWVTLDEGVDMDACSCAPSIEHHRIEDAAVVCWSAETGTDAPDAVGQIQERVLNLGPAQPRHSEQDQE